MNGYKYRANIAVNDKGNLRDIETLIKDELWASSLTDLNDPFEATYIDNIERALALFESVFGANIKDVKKYWEELILFKNNIGIYSLALSQADYPDNELMWAHYANSHKGFCIEYDIEKLQDSENYTFDVNRMKIEYKNEPPIIGLDDIEERGDLLPKSELKEAVTYLRNEWNAVVDIFNYGDTYLDNNIVERMNRYISLSRKNSLFFGSHKGAERGAILYTIALTCRMHKVNLFEYLTDVINRTAEW